MPRIDARQSYARPSRRESARQVLNAGSGSRSARQVNGLFRGSGWREVRIDVDARTQPDVVGSITDMADFADASFDAIWSSHVLEHLYGHQVPEALAEFQRVLHADGFAVISSPDLEAVAGALLDRGVDHVIYVSPAGPITPLDVLYGHRASIERGQHSMAHRTGFTCDMLGELVLEAGFNEVVATRRGYDLWVLALKENADRDGIKRQLAASGLTPSPRQNDRT